jgi:hypothetical protein
MNARAPSPLQSQSNTMSMTWRDMAPAAAIGVFIIISVNALGVARTLLRRLVSAAVRALMLEFPAIDVRRAGVPAFSFASVVVTFLFGALNFGFVHASKHLVD